jgi:hypothetical protein
VYRSFDDPVFAARYYSTSRLADVPAFGAAAMRIVKVFLLF